jgi:hypothetical protein
MSIEIEIKTETGYVCISCKGLYSLREAERVYKTAIDSALKLHSTRVLVEVFGVTGHVTTLDRYELSVFLAEYINMYAQDRIARFAVAGHEPPLDKNRFGMFVARNLGINVFVTTKLGEAIEWISM